jgi:tetratricopeptide (TPR) repeat protein
MGRLAARALVVLLVSGCTVSSEQLEYKHAEEAVAKNDYPGAIVHYKAVVDRYVKSPLAIKAAKEAARISHYQLNRPKDALPYYKHVVLYSSLADERIEAEKKLADIYFSQTLDYTQAIVEYNRLIELPHSSAEDFTYRLSVARSYYYLTNFYQAKIEIESILSRNFDKDQVFDALLLKANIFLTSKDLDDAVLTLKQIIEKYPQKAKTESIGLILAVAYEEQKNFAKAIETLQSIKDTYPRKAFIEQRIKTLQERQSFLPGAKGWKK